MSALFVIGVGMTQFARHRERPLEDLAREALNMALADAGCALLEVQTAFYSGVTNAALQGQFAIPGRVVFSKIGLEGIRGSMSRTPAPPVAPLFTWPFRGPSGRL
jgi:acetyl-CoA acetyltransferase